ncbi:MAG TPA: rod shape-determining protein RodA [Aquifex aeolicus]|uniref:Rod shape-determining protein RodA n=1 Tax=Aquifex aeolicus TaxID=63363 RepID=A0A7C5L6V3_AQUAO|nr:rod shape-determining protein RodA [Aquifex aeolicus]
MRFLGELFKGLDWLLVLPLLGIQIFGALGVYSASMSEGMPFIFKKHLLYIALSWLIILLLSREKFRNTLDLSLYVYLFTLFLLVLVLVMGKEVYGAKRWLSLGFINVQPSEFMKLSLVLLSAYLIPHIKTLRDRKVLLLFFSFSTPAVVTLKQPDLGTAATYFVPLVVMLFVRGIRFRYFAMAGLLLLILSPLIWNMLKDYQRKRILAVIDPYSDYSGSGYQLIQSVIAIGSGGISGKGLTKGTQSQLMFLPESHTDFIFSVIGEELGFLGTFLLSLLIFLLLLRILSYLRFTLISSESLFVAGVFSLLLFQYAVNILMTLGLFPVVGIPLPFVSFGGSSMLTFSAAIGILLSIYREYRHALPLLMREVNYE